MKTKEKKWGSILARPEVENSDFHMIFFVMLDAPKYGQILSGLILWLACLDSTEHVDTLKLTTSWNVWHRSKDHEKIVVFHFCSDFGSEVFILKCIVLVWVNDEIPNEWTNYLINAVVFPRIYKNWWINWGLPLQM